MKSLNQKVGSRRKVIVIFILAILLPSILVGYLSLNTVLQRRDAVNRLLESNLWMSGEAALLKCETALLDYETSILTEEYFRAAYNSRSDALSPSGSPRDSAHGGIFLLDSDFRIVYPQTTSPESEGSLGSTPDIIPNMIQQAERLSLIHQDYSGAIELYDTYLRSAPYDQRAFALDGLARCLMHVKDYSRALIVYEELSEQFSHQINRAGHPYGITASLQLATLERLTKKKSDNIHSLIELYSDLRMGKWIIKPSTYYFFLSEIETELQEQLCDDTFPELNQSYQNQKDLPSSYETRMRFVDLIERSIPSIRDKTTISERIGQEGNERIPVIHDSDYFLVSFRGLPTFHRGNAFIGGFVWNLDDRHDRIMLPILGGLNLESGLKFELISGNQEFSGNKTRVFSFKKIPVPWRLMATLPGIGAIERSARREMILYGSLLTVILILMILGVYLIIRDMARESEATRLKTEFVHNISHELKTPLTLIRLYGETLQRKKNLSATEKKESYEIITKESERLSHMVNNVLDFSRIETGRKEFHFKNGNIGIAIRNTLESYRYHLEKKGFSIHTEISLDLPEIEFDPEAIASVLVNLLSNAMKFSPKKKEVWVRLLKRDGSVVLQVKDTGIGIDQKEQTRIFQRFYRADDDVVSESSGSGLGLPLVKHTVEAHSGQIKVESAIGEGSTFTVILPLSVKPG